MNEEKLILCYEITQSANRLISATNMFERLLFEQIVYINHKWDLLISFDEEFINIFHALSVIFLPFILNTISLFSLMGS